MASSHALRNNSLIPFCALEMYETMYIAQAIRQEQTGYHISSPGHAFKHAALSLLTLSSFGFLFKFIVGQLRDDRIANI